MPDHDEGAFLADAKAHGEKRDEHRRRWALSLGIANGAALAALATAFVNLVGHQEGAAFAKVLWPMYISAWLFFGGVLTAGVTNFLRSRAEENARLKSRSERNPADRAKYKGWSADLFHLATFAEVISALAFVAGVSSVLLALPGVLSM